MRVFKDGVGIDAPPGWDARIFTRAPEDEVATTHPILHAASFALPGDRGDFGSGAVDVMGTEDVFVSLMEFHPDAAKTKLFQREGLPTLTPASFSPRKLQRTIDGQAGCQFFFHHKGRAFCLYVVLGDYGNRVKLTAVANELISRLDLESPLGQQ
jgi:hypothetical protein